MHFAVVPKYRPANFAVCRALGLGETDKPCPFASCRHSLLVRATEARNGEVQPTHPIEEFGQHPTCSLVEACKGESTPEAIAAALGFSVGEEEIIQRIALAKVADALGRVRDESRGVEMHVDGLPDYFVRIRTRPTNDNGGDS